MNINRGDGIVLKKTLKFVKLILCIFILLLLVSCGGDDHNVSTGTGSGSGSGSGGGSSGGSTTQNKLYYWYIGSVMGVDPDNPSSPFSLSNVEPQSGTIFDIFSFDLGDPQIQDFKATGRWAVFVGKDGRLYIANLYSTSPPSSAPVSNLTDICKIDKIEEFAMSGKVYLMVIVRTPGPDGKCKTSDDKIYSVTSNMGPQDAAYLVNDTSSDTWEPVESYPYGVSAEKEIIKKGSTLQVCDVPSLSNCTQIADQVDTVKGVYAPYLGSTMLYLVMSMLSGNVCIYQFDGTNLNKGYCGLDFKTGINDATALYFLDTLGNLWKLPFASYTDLPIQIFVGSITQILALTKSYIFVQTLSQQMLAISKLTYNVLQVLNIPTGAYLWFLYALNDKFYFNLQGYTSIQACQWSDSAKEATCTNNSYYAGIDIPTTGYFSKDNKTGTVQANLIYRVDSADASSGLPAGGVLKSKDPSTDTESSIGQLSTDENIYVTTFDGKGLGSFVNTQNYTSGTTWIDTKNKKIQQVQTNALPGWFYLWWLWTILL